MGKNKRLVPVVETQYEVSGYRMLTPCPFGKVTREGHVFQIKVGSGACHECGCFIRDDQEKLIVSCKGHKKIVDKNSQTVIQSL